jgi:hypothetical protein
MDEGSQLHRNGARPTSGATGKPAQGGGKEGFAVDATMAVEAPVLPDNIISSWVIESCSSLSRTVASRQWPRRRCGNWSVNR